MKEIKLKQGGLRMAERINRCSHCGCDEPILGIDDKLYCNNCGMSLENSSVTNRNRANDGRSETKNKMAEVAKLFGKKLGERFTIAIRGARYGAIFTQAGLDLAGAENPGWHTHGHGFVFLVCAGH